MPSYLDLSLLGIVLVSALLSMVRGFTREVLAIASWGAAAVAAYLLYPRVTPFLEPYIAKDTIRTVAAVAVVFFVTLVIVSILTVKLSDAILDSRVGALDRTLGFVFGAARGFLLGVVAFQFFTWLVKTPPEWVANAKTKPLLQMTGDDLVAMLPEDAVKFFAQKLNRAKPGGPSEDVPDEDAPAAPAPDKRTDASPPPAANGPTQADKASMDKLFTSPPATPVKRKP